jgi:hypothetical protein
LAVSQPAFALNPEKRKSLVQGNAWGLLRLKQIQKAEKQRNAQQ